VSSRGLVAAFVLLFAPLALAEQELPIYPGTTHTRIGKELLIGGELYRLAYFTTADSMKKVGKYFFDQWTSQGYPTTVDGDFQTEAVVSAFYTREGLVRSVVLRKHDGKTLGFSVLKDLWLHEPAKPNPGVIRIEGSVFTSDLASRDDSGAAHRAQLVEADLPTTRERVEKGFTASGFKLSRESSSPRGRKGERVLEFEKGAEQALVTLTEIDAQMTAVSQMWIAGGKKR
jgi:hypothetical protein